jgi:hypothetical protein
MRKTWRRWAAILLVAALFGGVMWWRSREIEPSYEGKPFTEWLREASTTSMNSAAEDEQVREVIRKIGTNGLPVLVRYLSKTDSSVKGRLIQWLPQSWALRLGVPEDHYFALAVTGFSILGANAAPAVPDLVALLGRSKSKVRGNALYILAIIGPPARPAIPAIRQRLKDNNPLISAQAAWTLSALERMDFTTTNQPAKAAQNAVK